MNVRVVILLISMSLTTGLFSAPRPDTNKPAQPQVVYVPVPVNATTQTPSMQQLDPIERDKIIDQQLIAHFMSILGNFGKVMLNPHSKENVTTNVANMIDGIVAVAHTITKGQRSQSPQAVNRLVNIFMRHIQHQQRIRAQRMHMQQ